MVVRLPEIPGSPYTPDEWLSTEQFSANQHWVFFSKEVYNEHALSGTPEWKDVMVWLFQKWVYI